LISSGQASIHSKALANGAESEPRVTVANAVLFNGELDLLSLRYNLLRKHVDIFIVGESPTSFAGSPKPLYFQENKNRWLPEDLARTRHVIYTLEHCSDRWEREREANRQLVQACMDLPTPTVTLLCDADEFPSPDQCAQARTITEPHSLPMTTYYRRANWEVAYSPHLPMGIAFPNSIAIERIPGAGMHQRVLKRLKGNLGAHLSYLGFSAADLKVKYGSFSHSELDFPAASNDALLSLADHYAVDHLGRPLWRGGGLLKFQSRAIWDSTQRLVANELPWLMADAPPRGSRFSRLAAAVLVDKVVNQRSDYWYRSLPVDPARLWGQLTLQDRLILAATTVGASFRRPFYGKLAAVRRRLPRAKPPRAPLSES
jgi:Glycosyltransferase family 17